MGRKRILTDSPPQWPPPANEPHGPVGLPQAKVISRPTWEYRHEWIDEPLFDGLASLIGAEGWELVSTIRDRRFFPCNGEPVWMNGYWCIFKRIKA